MLFLQSSTLPCWAFRPLLTHILPSRALRFHPSTSYYTRLPPVVCPYPHTNTTNLVLTRISILCILILLCNFIPACRRQEAMESDPDFGHHHRCPSFSVAVLPPYDITNHTSKPQGNNTLTFPDQKVPHHSYSSHLQSYLSSPRRQGPKRQCFIESIGTHASLSFFDCLYENKTKIKGNG